MGFKEMKMMKSTEPSVDEVGKGMKKGGKTKMMMGGMPRMQMGGALPMVAQSVAKKRPTSAAEMAAARPRGAALMRSAAMSRPSPGMPPQAMGRVKDGGSMKMKNGGESSAKHASEMSKMKTDLKSHEGKPASKAHKGLKMGGAAKCATGGVMLKYKKGGSAKCATGGVMKKYASGGSVSGYKEGGHCGMKSGGEAGFAKMKKGSC